jgi:phage gp29-like protein
MTMNDIKKSRPPAETDEIASVKRDPFLPLFSGLLQQNDDTLATRGQGKGIRLYEEIERDAHAFSCLHKRKMAVISRPWEVTPASESALDQRAAEVVRTQLSNIGFDHLCLNLLDAINKGFSVGEILWATTGSEIVASEVRARDQRRFWFGENYELRLKTLTNMLPGEELPERKFIVHSLGAKDGNPYGMGLGSKLFWLVWFKRQGITFWLTLLDKFGSPTAVGKYPNGTQPPDQQKLLDALSAISQDSGVIVPEGMMIELLEATRGGNVGYEQMIRYMDEQISYCVLGEAPSAKGSGGALASAAITRNEVRLELVQFDADMLSATLNNTLIKWITEYNVPGATAPTVWRKIIEAEDIKIRAERDQILFNMGMRPDDVYQAENYPGWTFQAPPKKQIQGGGTPVAFAESAQAVFPGDALAARLSIEVAPHWDAMLEQLRGIVHGANSLESLRDDLLASFGDLPDDELVKVMAAGFAVAEMAGMSDVNDGR